MDKQDFKAAALASLLPIKKQIGAQAIALDLYELYGMKGNIDSWCRHISDCFDEKKPEFFHFTPTISFSKWVGSWD